MGRNAEPPAAASPADDSGRAAELGRGEPTSGRTGWPRALIALEVPDFRYLWIGTQLMLAGMLIQMATRSFLVYDITESGKILALVSSAQVAPVLALSPIGGAIADRIERRRLVIVFQAITALTGLLVAVSIATGTITWGYLLLAAVVYGTTFSFAMPARNALVKSLVGRRRVANAVALQASGMSAQALLAPAAGGILYATIGPDGAYFVGAGLGFAALAFTFMITRGVGKVEPTGSPMMADIRSGIAYVLRSDLLVGVMTMVVVTLLLVQSLPFLLPVMVVEVYGRDSGAFGLLLSALGLGSLLGSVAIASTKRWRPGLVLIGAALCGGLALLGVAMLPYYYAGLALFVVVGLTDAARRTHSNAIFMEEVEDAYLGRVISVYYMASGLLPASLLVSGVAIDVLGSQLTVGSMGLLLTLCSLAMLFTHRRLRDLR